MRRNFKILAFGGLGLVLIWGMKFPALANSRIEELRLKIESRQEDIKQLEIEIAKHQKELEATAAESRTLKEEINRLNTTIKKLTTEVRVTEKQIAASTLEIERLALEINNTSDEVVEQKATLAGLLRTLRALVNDNLVELVFAEESFSNFWDNRGQMINLQDRVAAKIDVLKDLKSDLEGKKQGVEEEKYNLKTLNIRLIDQQKIIEQNKTAKNELLTQTKNREANYQKVLKEKEGVRDAFLQELFDYESQLRVEIDPSSLPPSGRGVLRWPLDMVFITQYFGKTFEAARLYVSGTHNGIDLRASPGTLVKAAASGEVIGSGDTDLICRGASYGRWVLIRHYNGLSTLYAHLSLIKVTTGQKVIAGDLIGYSGQSGYATGPHLHFAVFATLGVRIDKLASRICPDAVFTLPMAPPNAYLDPMQYL